MDTLIYKHLCTFLQELVAFSLVVAAVMCQDSEGPPEPYNFSYSTDDKEGSSSHEEMGDGSGKITGKYTLMLADGRMRVVTYWADESGFHADVVTNEQGILLRNSFHLSIDTTHTH